MQKIQHSLLAFGAILLTATSATAKAVIDEATAGLALHIPIARPFLELNWFERHPEGAIVMALMMVIAYGLFVRFLFRHYESLGPMSQSSASAPIPTLPSQESARSDRYSHA